MNLTNILKPRLINKSTRASDQRTLFETVPMTVFPIPIVNTDVKVAAGVVKEVGTTAEFPTTIWMARASPKARAKDNGRENTWFGRIKRHSPNGLPASSPHGKTGFTIVTWYRTKRICRHKGYGW